MKHVAFLRAINVGGHTVRMEDLRRLFEKLGFTGVETFIASGNVVFTAAGRATRSLGERIETGLEKALGYPVATFLRTCPEVAAVANFRPFPDHDTAAPGNILYVAFAGEEPGAAARRRLEELRSPVDDFRVHGREIYWLRRTGAGESEYSGARLEKAAALPLTVRNVTTVRKLAARLAT